MSTPSGSGLAAPVARRKAASKRKNVKKIKLNSEQEPHNTLLTVKFMRCYSNKKELNKQNYLII
jgi:hypothetical protein